MFAEMKIAFLNLHVVRVFFPGWSNISLSPQAGDTMISSILLVSGTHEVDSAEGTRRLEEELFLLDLLPTVYAASL